MSDYEEYEYGGNEYGEDDEYGEHNERDVYARVSAFNNLDIELIDNIRDSKLLFPLVVQQFCMEYSSQLNLKREDIEYLIQQKDKVYKYEYKNPRAYVLGYIVSENGAKINKDKFEMIKKFLSSHNIEDIMIEDIIRYARLWINLI